MRETVPGLQSTDTFAEHCVIPSRVSTASRVDLLVDWNMQEMSPVDMEEALKQGMESQGGQGEGQQVEISMEMDPSQQGQQGDGEEG